MRFLVVALCVGFLPVGHAQAEVTIEGDVSRLVLSAQGSSRVEALGAILRHFGIKNVSGNLADGTLDGRFSGSLGQILTSIAPLNGFAVAYVDGRPARLTFTGSGTDLESFFAPTQ